MFDSDSDDYIVEHYVKPDKIGAPLVNDDSADILGNFDDKKRKKIQENSFDEEPEQQQEAIEDESTEEDDSSDDDEVPDHHPSGAKRPNDGEEPASSNNKKKKSKKKAESNGQIGEEQIQSLLRGVSKPNKFVLYVTNLNFATSKERLIEYFSVAGPVKTVRIPKKRKGGFAFVEMVDITSFKNAFSLHNSTLDERVIKVQLSEAGTKKSANKKNILKQKNRKLAEMRNETKSFTKSGKNYDKTIKKEIAKEQMQRTKMWERRKMRKANKKNGKS